MSEPIPDDPPAVPSDVTAATGPRCPTSGCGSPDAFLDTSTARTWSWVQVRKPGLPPEAATWHWYCSQACAAAALGGTTELERAIRSALVDELDAAAARLSTLYPGDLLMLLRAHGLQMARRIVAPDRPAEGAAFCWLCGCTEDDACAGGCWWVPDPDGVRDMCSNCTDRPAEQCATPGCGSTDDLDASDPALWGWIHMQVAGTDGPARWVCSAGCVGTVLSAAAAELAENDMTVAARGVAQP